MKKTLLFFVMLTAVSTISFARRLDDPAASARMAVVRSGATFKVYYKSTAISKVAVTIYDANGGILFTENLGKVDNFMRPYNFSALPEGEYTIELQDALGKQIERVEYSQGKIFITARLIKVANAESKYLLMIPNHGDNAWDVRILDDSDNVLYTGHENVSGDFAKMYDLTSVSGKVSFEITNEKGQRKTIQY